LFANIRLMIIADKARIWSRRRTR